MSTCYRHMLWAHAMGTCYGHMPAVIFTSICRQASAACIAATASYLCVMCYYKTNSLCDNAPCYVPLVACPCHAPQYCLAMVAMPWCWGLTCAWTTIQLGVTYHRYLTRAQITIQLDCICLATYNTSWEFTSPLYHAMCQGAR